MLRHKVRRFIKVSRHPIGPPCHQSQFEPANLPNARITPKSGEDQGERCKHFVDLG